MLEKSTTHRPRAKLKRWPATARLAKPAGGAHMQPSVPPSERVAKAGLLVLPLTPRVTLCSNPEETSAAALSLLASPEAAAPAGWP